MSDPSPAPAGAGPRDGGRAPGRAFADERGAALVRGVAWGGVEPALREELDAWLRGGPPPEGTPLKPGRVLRRGAIVLKLYPPPIRLRDRVRRAPALRVASQWERLLPIPSPAPRLAAALVRGGPRRSVLASDFVEGRSFERLFPHDAAAVAAFPSFLAELHRRGVVHADFHLHNALWDGARWLLLDLDGVTHALRRLRARSFLLTQWARIWLGVDRSEGLFPLFERFVAEAGLGWDPAAAWERVRERASAWRAEAT